VGLLDGQAGAGRGGGGGAQDALQVREGGDELLGLLVGLVLVVVLLVAAGDELHLRVLLLGPGIGAVLPLVVGLGGEAADEVGPLALAAHELGEVVHHVGAVLLVHEGLDVVVDVLLVGGLVADDHDARLAGLLEDRLQGLGGEGNHADGVHLLRDQVLDDLHLLGGVGLGRPELEGVVAGVLPELRHPLAHPVEPRDPVHLHHRGDGVLGLLGLVRGGHECGRQGEQRQGERECASHVTS
jgi:hypothetical protein